MFVMYLNDKEIMKTKDIILALKNQGLEVTKKEARYSSGRYYEAYSIVGSPLVSRSDTLKPVPSQGFTTRNGELQKRGFFVGKMVGDRLYATYDLFNSLEEFLEKIK